MLRTLVLSKGLPNMDSKDIKEITEMCDEALSSLARYESSGEAGNVFAMVRSVGEACLEGDDIDPGLKKKIPIRSRHSFKQAVAKVYRLATLSQGSGNNINVRNALTSIKEHCLKAIEREIDLTPPSTLFYSWQSSLPNNTNRSFIESCIGKALQQVNEGVPQQLKIHLDSDTRGVPGSPDIVSAILSKIDSAAFFVADVSILENGVPNPNVLFELGYALKSLGAERIIMVFNTAYGKPTDLPFDLGLKRQILYSLTKDVADKSEVRKEVAGKLVNAIKIIVGNS